MLDREDVGSQVMHKIHTTIIWGMRPALSSIRFCVCLVVLFLGIYLNHQPYERLHNSVSSFLVLLYLALAYLPVSLDCSVSIYVWLSSSTE